jgi:hypothetical protein
MILKAPILSLGNKYVIIGLAISKRIMVGIEFEQKTFGIHFICFNLRISYGIKYNPYKAV